MPKFKQIQIINCPKITKKELEFIVKNSEKVIINSNHKINTSNSEDQLHHPNLVQDDLNSINNYIQESECIIHGGTEVILNSQDIKKAENLKFVIAHATGYSMLPFELTNSNKIHCFNIPKYARESTSELILGYAFQKTNCLAEYTIGRIIDNLRGIHLNHNNVIENKASFGGIEGSLIKNNKFFEYNNPNKNIRIKVKDYIRFLGGKFIDPSLTNLLINEEILDTDTTLKEKDKLALTIEDYSSKFIPTDSKSVAEKRIGIIGLGNIGSYIANFFSILGCEINYCSKKVHLDIRSNYRNHTRVHNLINNSDIIITAVNLDNSTKNLISSDVLKSVKPGSIIINTSRAEIIDLSALADLLNDKKIFYYSDQVWDRNIPSHKSFLDQLKSFDNTLLNSHIGFNTVESKNIKANALITNLEYILDHHSELNLEMPSELFNKIHGQEEDRKKKLDIASINSQIYSELLSVKPFKNLQEDIIKAFDNHFFINKIENVNHLIIGTGPVLNPYGNNFPWVLENLRNGSISCLDRDVKQLVLSYSHLKSKGFFKGYFNPKFIAFESQTVDQYHEYITLNELIKVLEETEELTIPPKENTISFLKHDIINKLPYKDETFDSIDSTLVLHHVSQYQNLFLDILKDIYRVLKKGGIFYLGEGNVDMTYSEKRIKKLCKDIFSLKKTPIIVTDLRDNINPVYVHYDGNFNIARTKTDIKDHIAIKINENGIVTLNKEFTKLLTDLRIEEDNLDNNANINLIDIYDIEKKGHEEFFTNIREYYHPTIEMISKNSTNFHNLAYAIILEQNFANQGLHEYYLPSHLLKKLLLNAGFSKVETRRPNKQLYKKGGELYGLLCYK